MNDTHEHRYVWPCLSYRDARAAIAFLVDAFGFEERAVYAREDDPAVVEHAELRWPLGGGVMFGTAGKDDSPFGTRPPGNDSVYVVCDDPDGLFARATAAGAEVVRGLARRGLRLARLHRPRPGGQPLELRHVRRRLASSSSDSAWPRLGAVSWRSSSSPCRASA